MSTMTGEPAPTESTTKNVTDAKPQGGFETGPVERLTQIALLESIVVRLSRLEEAITSRADSDQKRYSSLILDFAKIIFGGWQVFGLLLLILFYGPLHDALSSIPDKVRAADEIALPGISLKSTIRNIAADQGFIKLGEKIPTLSGPAIAHLLKAPRQNESLVSFTNADDHQHLTAINYPNDSTLHVLQELLRAKLIEVEGGLGEHKPMDAQGVAQLLHRIQDKFPGRATSREYRQEMSLILNSPLKPDFEPKVDLMWKLSEDGVRAVDVVLRAVTTQLEQESDGKKGKYGKKNK